MLIKKDSGSGTRGIVIAPQGISINPQLTVGKSIKATKRGIESLEKVFEGSENPVQLQETRRRIDLLRQSYEKMEK